MPEYVAPGVHVEEVGAGAKSIDVGPLPAAAGTASGARLRVADELANTPSVVPSWGNPGVQEAGTFRRLFTCRSPRGRWRATCEP